MGNIGRKGIGKEMHRRILGLVSLTDEDGKRVYTDRAISRLLKIHEDTVYAYKNLKVGEPHPPQRKK